ncbi:MAG: hypothetical protein J0652_02595 [Desulfobulbaceae bacterium]|nr:hypothetical protein [Desulfobulbaceae bacterium]
MQKIKTIQINGNSFTVKELPVRVIWNLFNNGSAAKQSGVERVQSLLKLACPELTEELLLDLYPSEVKEIWTVFEEVNADFLGVIRQVGLDVAMIGAVKESITTSIMQFAPSLAQATAKASGTTGTDSSSLPLSS